MGSFGARLKRERNRLKLTQEAFANFGGVEPNAQTNYETGKRWPRADYLQQVSAIGVDITYLMTGERSPPVAPSAAPELNLAASGNESTKVATTLITSLGQNLMLTAHLMAAIANTENLTKDARGQIAEGLRDVHSETERFASLVSSLTGQPIDLSD